MRIMRFKRTEGVSTASEWQNRDLTPVWLTATLPFVCFLLDFQEVGGRKHYEAEKEVGEPRITPRISHRVGYR